MTAAVDMTPGSAEWTRRLTASRFGRLFGGPGSWRSLRREMLAPPRTGGSAATEHGKENEPRALALYEILTGRCVERPGFRQLGVDPRIGCTVDARTTCPRLVEVKCPVVYAKHALARQGIYDQDYHWQMIGGLWIWEDDVCDFVSFNEQAPPGEDLAIVPVHRDERAIARLRDTAFRFLDWFETADDDTPTHDFIQPGAAGVPKLF